MSDNIAISVENVSKKYRIYGSPSNKLKELLHPFKKKYHKEFWALRDINIDIPRGTSFGIIGQNGSGKSTLLQIICGILQPTTGSVQKNGRISALLELGSGFNREFTGRENVFMQGAIMGISREEMEERFPMIEEFAEIGHFIEQPAKTYSSGMYVRLAFATAINVDPDILIVDEALAVGDVKFQAKCFRKFKEFRDKKKTILFVTHSTEQIVRHCDRAILLSDGKKLAEGEPKDISNQYMELLFGKSHGKKSLKIENNEEHGSKIVDFKQIEDKEVLSFIKEPYMGDKFGQRKSYNKNEHRWGNREVEILDYLIVSGNNIDPVQCDPYHWFKLYLKVKFYRDVEHPIYGLMIKTYDGVLVYGNNSRDWDKQHRYVAQRAGNVTVVCFSFRPILNNGHYFFSIGVAEGGEGLPEIPLDRRYDSIHLAFLNPNLAQGLVDLGIKFENIA